MGRAIAYPDGPREGFCARCADSQWVLLASPRECRAYGSCGFLGTNIRVSQIGMRLESLLMLSHRHPTQLFDLKDWTMMTLRFELHLLVGGPFETAVLRALQIFMSALLAAANTAVAVHSSCK